MSKIRQSAHGEECLIRSPVCNHDPETTVLCHLPSDAMGAKSPDWMGAYGCSSCHELVDGRRTLRATGRHEIKLWFHQAVIRTIAVLIEKDLIKICD